MNIVQKLREKKRLRLAWEAQEELQKKKAKEKKLRRENERRLNPKTKEDFELLYHALERKFFPKEALLNLQNISMFKTNLSFLYFFR